MSKKLVNSADLAEILGVTASYVYKLKKSGVLVFDESNRIDPEVAKAAIAANADPKKAGLRKHHAAKRAAKKKRVKSGGTEKSIEEKMPAVKAVPQSSGLTYAEARVLRESMQAKLAELEYRKAKGELVSAASVTQAITDGAVQIRNSLELIPDKLSLVVAAEIDPVKVHALLQGEIDNTLAELSRLLEIDANGR